MSPQERLEQFEARHITPMTEHELEVKRNDRAWKKNTRARSRHQEWPAQYEAQREKDRLERIEQNKEMDKRIADLVSGIGEFIRRETQAG